MSGTKLSPSKDHGPKEQSDGRASSVVRQLKSAYDRNANERRSSVPRPHAIMNESYRSWTVPIHLTVEEGPHPITPTEGLRDY